MPRRLDRGTIVVIPARFKSSRFPGKPLAMIAGVSLLERTWRQTAKAVEASSIHIATDDDEIAAHAGTFGANVVMTSPEHPTGTDRCHEVAQQLDADLVINVQGDEPLVDPASILAVVDAAASAKGRIVNARSLITTEADFRSPTVPKVVTAPDGTLLYMSRAAIPTDKQLSFGPAWRQVCVYAFPRDALAAFAANDRTPLEAAEDIEILRFIELGHVVKMIDVPPGSIAVDVPEDIAKVELALESTTDG